MRHHEEPSRHLALFRVINRYVGNFPPMPGVFPDYAAPVIGNTGAGTEKVPMRWGMPPPVKTGGPPEFSQHDPAALAHVTQGGGEPLPRISNGWPQGNM